MAIGQSDDKYGGEILLGHLMWLMIFSDLILA
jgi:hypothetical protein